MTQFYSKNKWYWLSEECFFIVELPVSIHFIYFNEGKLVNSRACEEKVYWIWITCFFFFFSFPIVFVSLPSNFTIQQWKLNLRLKCERSPVFWKYKMSAVKQWQQCHRIYMTNIERKIRDDSSCHIHSIHWIPMLNITR